MEIIAALVIIAIIALIVVPIVLDISEDAEKTINARNVDAYGRAIENAMAIYKMENGRYAKSIDDLKVEYRGAKVKCNEIVLNKNATVYLSKCYVNRSKVMDLDDSKKWYSYGNIEYDYKIGESITYNNELYYVVNNSKTSDSYVSLLKYMPLTTDEVNLYGGVGTENNHVNINVTQDTSSSNYQKAYDSEGFGSMVYYSDENCHPNFEQPWSSDITYNCKFEYEESDIKYVVDAWAQNSLNLDDLEIDLYGYRVRLVFYDEISTINKAAPYYTKIFSNYYWCMNKGNHTCGVSEYGIGFSDTPLNAHKVRPVINLKKEVIGGKKKKKWFYFN